MGTHRPSPAGRIVSLTVLLALLVGGCTSDDGDFAAPATSEPTSTEPMPSGPCEPIGGDENALLVTANCDDPLLTQPYTDVDEERTIEDPETGEEVSFRYVHGGFEGSEARFSLYFPAEDQYEGRFFQRTYPTNDAEDADPDLIAFAISSGAYLVSTNNAGGLPSGLPLAGYRANAASAKYSRVVATDLYETDERARGYLFGSSGGAYQTIGGIENTRGVWDGAVPVVPGPSNAIPTFQAAQLFGLRLLHDDLPQIADALEPGGSGNPYAGLDDAEQAALRELSDLGVPLRGWWAYESMNGAAFPAVAGGVRALDAAYVDDFWSAPGYEGADDPSVQAARVQQETTITALVETSEECTEGEVIGQTCAGSGFQLADLPAPELLYAADLVVLSGAAAGTTLPILEASDGTVSLANTADEADVSALRPGDRVRIDNSWSIALQYYGRHSVPTSDQYGWDQYRDENGDPVAPQRPLLTGEFFTTTLTGAPMSGRFEGKMIVIASAMDMEAFPWSADWYRSLVEENLGEDLDDRFRLWWMDNAGHTEPRSTYANTHNVDISGAVEQALLDLDAWVLDGTAPAASSSYQVEDTQVELAEGVDERAGIQPLVTLTVDGAETVEVDAGSEVEFEAEVEAPDGGGEILRAEWDFEGTGEFPIEGDVDEPSGSVTLTESHTYEEPGTYFAVVRVAAHRDGDSDDPYRLLQNLQRVRVVVR